MALTQVAGGMLLGGITSSQITSVSGASLTGTQNIPKATLPSGTVLQVVSYEWTGVGSYNTNNTNIATSIAATITPSTTSSRIMIVGRIAAQGNSGYQGGGFTIYRNSTNLNNATGGSASNGSQMMQFWNPSFGQAPVGNAGNYYDMQQVPMAYVDSPATTSATTYTVYATGVPGANNVLVNQAQNSNNRATSQIILMEIA
jgi:hypothetical protein